MRLRVPVLVALVISSQASCKLDRDDDEVKVLLPPPPVLWQIAFPRLGFRVVTRDARNTLQETHVDDWREPVALTCARNVNTPVLAWPWEPRVPGLRPAGGFYPLSLRTFHGGEVLELTWEDGAAAYVMSRVAAQGPLDISLFNVERLRRFLRKHADPWALDLDAVAQNIARGELTAWDIDMLPCRDVELEPGPGTWLLESPLSSPFEATNGRILLSGVSLGSHYLFSLGGACWRVEIGQQEAVMIPAR